MLVLKVRGDGRSYLLNISTRGYFDVMWNDMYHYVLFTRGGPYWQYTKVCSHFRQYQRVWSSILFTINIDYLAINLWFKLNLLLQIPFSKFFLASKGRVQDKQYPIPLNKITNFGISAGDKIPGSFSLEIDYVGVEFDPNHHEDFAYEMYNTGKYIAATQKIEQRKKFNTFIYNW